MQNLPREIADLKTPMTNEKFPHFFRCSISQGLTETERSVAWELALEEDLTDLRMSYSYGFDMFADELTLFAEDYSYSMSYDL